ncbi:MAG: DUF4443 domain-containing protein [Candidatus Nitrosocaldaceae archaeon]
MLDILDKITYRYAPSRAISFETVHVFKALQLISKRSSRSKLIKELELGEGSIKTLIKHLKMYNLIYTNKCGTYLTEEGRGLYNKLFSFISECELPSSSIAIGRFNYAILLRGFAYVIRSGIEQRDAAIKVGALGATTLTYNQGFMMQGNIIESLENEPYEILMKLEPKDGDAIIIGSANDRLKAELGAKNAVIATLRMAGTSCKIR